MRERKSCASADAKTRQHMATPAYARRYVAWEALSERTQHEAHAKAADKLAAEAMRER